MIVIAASGVELLPASWATGLALHVLGDRQFGSAGAAKDCFLIPFNFWPDLDRVIGESGMAIFACVVNAAALHLDRDNVGKPVIVPATGLCVEVHAAHIGKTRSHNQFRHARRIRQVVDSPS